MIIALHIFYTGIPHCFLCCCLGVGNVVSLQQSS